MRKQRSELPLQVETTSTSSSLSGSSHQFDNEQQTSQPSKRSLERINSVVERNKRSRNEENAVTNALANRAYHLPGYSYCADWCQYLVNNHLVFGMFCRHPKHPIGTRIRALNLLGSALFGLAITNVIWLGCIYYDEDPDSILFKISFQNENDGDGISLQNDFLNATNTTTIKPYFELMLPGPKDEYTAETLENTLQVTKGMMLLWTMGGSLHAVYDSAIWYASACACCLPGNRCESLGCMRKMSGYVIIFVVVLVTALASFAVVVRATLLSSHDDIDLSNLDSAGLVDDAIHVGEGLSNNLGVFEFVIIYFLEFILALFVYYPLFGTILFTGCLDCLDCLDCGKMPMLGGRPYEMRQLERSSRRSARRGEHARS